MGRHGLSSPPLSSLLRRRRTFGIVVVSVLDGMESTVQVEMRRSLSSWLANLEKPSLVEMLLCR